ncbi:MAG: YraN family protein [Oscillospiraceae bacterium]
MDRKLSGELGEKLVAKYYKRKWYKLLCTNYTTRFGEIDVIVKKGDTVVFVEVKTRKNADFMAAKEAVTPSKQHKIRTTASIFLQEYELSDAFVRFDVAEVYINEKGRTINIITDAF